MATVAKLVIQASADIGAAMTQLTALERRLSSVGSATNRASAAISGHAGSLRDFNREINVTNNHLNRHHSLLGTVHNANNNTTRSTNALGNSFNNTGRQSAGFWTWLVRIGTAFSSVLIPATITLGAQIIAVGSAFTVAAGGAGVFALAIAAGIMAAQKGVPGTEGLKKAIDDLKQAWINFGVATAKDTTPILARSATLFGQALQKLLPLVTAMAPAFDYLLSKLDKFINGGPLDRLVQYLSLNAPNAFKKFVDIVGNVLVGLGGIFKAFFPYGMQLLDVIEKNTKAFAAWGQNLENNKAFKDFIEYVKGTGGDAWDALKSIGEALTNVLSALRPFSEALIPVTKAVADLIAAMPEPVIQAIAAAWLAFRGVAIVIGVFQSLQMVIQGVMGIVNGAVMAWRTFMFAIAAFGGVSLVTVGWILLIAAAIAGLVVGLYFLVTHWDTVWNWIKSTAETIWNFLGSKWGWLVALIGPVGWILAIAAHWDQVWNFIKSVAETIWNGLVAAWSAVANAFIAAWNAVAGALTAAWTAVWNAVLVAGQAVWNGIVAAWNAVCNAFAAAWNAIGGALQAAWNAVWNAISAAGNAIWNGLLAGWNSVVNALKASWDAISGALTAAWNATWNGIKAAGDAIWNAVLASWNAIINAMKAAWDAVSSALTATWNAVWNALRSAAEGVWNAMKAAWDAWLNVMKAAWDAFASILTAAWNAFWNAVREAAQAIWNALKAAWDAWLSVMKAAWDAFSSAMTAAWNAFWNAVRDFAKAVWDNIVQIATGFWNTMKQLFQSSLDFVKGVWQSAWDAIKNAFNTIKDAILNAANDFWNKLKGGFEACANGIKTVWDKIRDYVSAPIKWVIDVVWNKTLVPGWNAISKLWNGDKMEPVGLAFADGGYVRGPGSGRSDSIKARLSNGEYVVKASSVQKYGKATLDALNAGTWNNRAVVLGFPDGGDVPPPIERDANDRPLGTPGGQGASADNDGEGDNGGGGLFGSGIGPDFGPDVAGAVEDAARAAGGAVADTVEQIGDFVTKVVYKGIEFLRGAAAEAFKKLMAPVVKLAEQYSQGGLSKDSMLGKVPSQFVKKVVDDVYNFIKQKDQEASFANGFISFRPWQPGDEQRVNYHGGLMNKRTQEMLQHAEGLLKKSFQVLQGSYSTGVSKSAGTHDGGGVLDLTPHDNTAVGALRASGFAAWARSQEEGFSPHIHAVAVGDRELSPAAAAQVDAFFRGRNGLANDGPDTYMPPGGVGGNVIAWINQSLGLTHTPPPNTLNNWVAGMSTLISRESGGNPKAVNNSDSNAAAGTPSKGLCQVIQPTFDAYHQPGTSNDIFDPIANICAAINYIKARYGDIANVQQANPGLPPKGYARGGVARRGWAMVGEYGAELVNFGRSSRVYNNKETMAMLSPRDISAGGVHVTIGDGAIKIDINGNATPETIDKLNADLIPALKMAILSEVGKR